ncbi:MAG: protein-export chaperone SecB [Burkholderiales bacterium]|nr:protein-export chaperone SecB [Burkholderiales bacterium]
MAEDQNPQQAPGAAPQQPTPTFAIQRIYLKDASLEIPHAPDIFLVHDNPQINVQLEVEQHPLQEANVYEVVVRATVTAKVTQNNEEQTMFLVECKQGGIFLLQNFPNDQMPMILGITCPTVVYPYLRANISDLMVRAGFPPVYLGEVNFEALFIQRMQQQAANAPTTPQ